MRVGVNLAIIVPNKIGGLEHYIRRQLAALLDLTDWQFALFTSPLAAPSFSIVPGRVSVHSVSEASEAVLLQAISTSKVDLWWCPWAGDWKPLRPGVPSAVTVPDLQHEHFPGNFESADLANRRLSYFLAAHCASIVLTFSQHTRQDLSESYGVHQDRIHAIPLDVGYDWEAAKPTKQLLNDLQHEHGAGFLYYPANTWPHKDHILLLQALKRLRDAGRPYRLVLTGSGDYDRARVEDAICALGLEQQVRLLGTVEPPVVRALYQLSGALVFPSRFEGFGMPLVEAMRSGTPVLCSDSTSLPEVGGDAVRYFATGDIEQLVDGLVHIMEDNALRQDLILLGHQRAGRFSWEETARATAHAFRIAVGADHPIRPETAAIEELLERLEGIPAQLAAADADRAARLDAIARMGKTIQHVCILLEGARAGSRTSATGHKLIHLQALIDESLSRLRSLGL
jgi:glycosyltransferase involved in cell wall biosynthesis